MNSGALVSVEYSPNNIMISELSINSFLTGYRAVASYECREEIYGIRGWPAQ